MRLIPRSIQGRMIALSALATLVALAIAGTLIAGVLGRIVTGGVDQRLDAELALMASTVSANGVDRSRLMALRGALDAGEGWHWRIVAPGIDVGSADLPMADELPGPPGEGPPGLRREDEHRHHADRPHPLDGHDRSGGAIHARRLAIATTGGVAVLTAAAPRSVIVRPVLSALTPLAVTLALLGAVLAIAAIVQIRLGLRPVRRLRDGVAGVRAGTSSAVSEDQPDELRPLAAELNALIRDNDAALAQARASAANLGHALKTPVATLSLALRGDPRGDQVERINATIRHHLSRARTGAAPARTATPLAPAIRDLVATIARLTDNDRVAIERRVPDEIGVAMDPADFDELAGNLIDNALRHASSRVVIQATAARQVTLTVTDDGPGIPAVDRQRATRPGVRLDERGDGHGFGLAIVRELAELHGGTLTLDEAPGGGLVATVTLPLAKAPTP